MYEFTASNTLTAQWSSSDTNNPIIFPDAITRSDTPETAYTVYFNPNEGSCLTTSLSAARTTSYRFAGWNTNSSGTGPNYATGISVTLSKAINLYAKWIPSTSTASITLPIPTRNEHTFDGWYTSDGKKAGDAGASYTPSGNETLHAQWTQQSADYIICFYGNGNTDGEIPDPMISSGTSNQVIMGNLTTKVPTRTGYTFRGWSASQEYSAKRVARSPSYGGGTDRNRVAAQQTNTNWTYQNYCTATGGNSSNKTLVLYAQWEPDKIKITLDPNGGSLGDEIQYIWYYYGISTFYSYEN